MLHIRVIDSDHRIAKVPGRRQSFESSNPRRRLFCPSQHLVRQNLTIAVEALRQLAAVIDDQRGLDVQNLLMQPFKCTPWAMTAQVSNKPVDFAQDTGDSPKAFKSSTSFRLSAK